MVQLACIIIGLLLIAITIVRLSKIKDQKVHSLIHRRDLPVSSRFEYEACLCLATVAPPDGAIAALSL